MLDFTKKAKNRKKNDWTGVSTLDFCGKALVSFEALRERLVRFKYDLEVLASPPG